MDLVTRGRNASACRKVFEVSTSKTAKTRPAGASVGALAATLRSLRDDAQRAAWGDPPATDDPSVANMRAYLALRQRDNRALQSALSHLGLSSLGRSEAHVLATLERVLGLVERLAAEDSVAMPVPGAFHDGGERLRRRSKVLFGDRPSNRETRIMVTMPSEAATDSQLVRAMVGAGMDCARINSAHDDPSAWVAMASHVRSAGESIGRRVPILVDLPGPKLRTGPIESGPEVVHLRPRHDELGAVVAPARAWLAAEGVGPVPEGADVVLPVAAAWLAALAPGDDVSFADARGRHRTFQVGAGSRTGRWIETGRGAYLVSGTVLKAASGDETRSGVCRVGCRSSRSPSAKHSS